MEVSNDELCDTQRKVNKMYKILTSKERKLLKELEQCNDKNIQNCADEIHSMTCDYSHTDQCGYFDAGWSENDKRFHINNTLSYAYKRISIYNEIVKLIENKKINIEDIKQYLIMHKLLNKLWLL